MILFLFDFGYGKIFVVLFQRHFSDLLEIIFLDKSLQKTFSRQLIPVQTQESCRYYF